ncbi:fidgetin [Chanos chanos]|uniref:Fidgetin n=1 Tax=Chanos chanos TaxID=29144 RepID=A0A6J2W0G3_CHACN|nr:fidgetin-like [Chanos chanos]
MQWTPEQTQWAEQHFDITSTTRSPAHKSQAFRGQRLSTSSAAAYQYSWANDDISALTASNLLKRYAERYSAILEVPCDRNIVGYPDTAVSGSTGLINGRKTDADPWQEGVYPSLGCVPEVLPKGVSDVSVSVCSSPGVGSGSLTEPSFSSSSCGSQSGAQEYAGTTYNGAYLHPGGGYSAVHPAPALSSPLLQPTPSHASLVPTYSANTSPSLAPYNYAPAGYAPQNTMTSGYSPPPPSSYLPTGIAAPTPLPTTGLAGYSYPPQSLAPIMPATLNGSATSANALKRKTYYMPGQGEMGPYEDFGFSGQANTEPPSAHSPLFRPEVGDDISSSQGSGFDQSIDGRSLTFKPVGHGGSLTPPGYGSKTPHSGERLADFGSPTATMSERSDCESRQHFSATSTSHTQPTASSHTHKVSTTHTLSIEEQLKTVDPRVIELVSSEVVQQLPLLDWSALIGLDAPTAALKDHILWPALQSDPFSRHSHSNTLTAPPQAILLFGPRGAGQTLLARCVASQLGATFFHLRCSLLLSDWLAEREEILRATLLLAHTRQPSVVLLSEVEVVLALPLHEEAPTVGLRQELLSWLDRQQHQAKEGRTLLLCSTNQPQELEDQLVRRYFNHRVLVPLPDAAARLQIIGQTLSQNGCCLSEEDAGLLAQRTGGLTARELRRICQEAVRGVVGGSGLELSLSAILPGQVRALSYQDFHSVLCETQANSAQRDMDLFTEWDRMLHCST